MSELPNSPERELTIEEEAEMVERAQADREAFGEIYQQYVRRIYNYIYYRTGNHQETEDLTAKVFFRAMDGLPKYTNRGLPFSAWLYRIAHNLVANWYRDRGRRKIIPLDSIAPDDPSLGEASAFNLPEAAVQGDEERSFLMRAIRQLPEDRQQLLIFKFVERLTNAEIGSIMGRSEGAIKSLYHRTLIALRKIVGKNDKE
jgi:RNA polymerase sigma-70 factor (ECF subfamily)